MCSDGILDSRVLPFCRDKVLHHTHCLMNFVFKQAAFFLKKNIFKFFKPKDAALFLLFRMSRRFTDPSRYGAWLSAVGPGTGLYVAASAGLPRTVRPRPLRPRPHRPHGRQQQRGTSPRPFYIALNSTPITGQPPTQPHVMVEH